jgi:hypothetical protein
VLLFTDSDCALEQSCLWNLAVALRRHADDVAFQLAVSSPGATLVQKVEALRLEAVQASLLLASGYTRYANTSGFALRAAYSSVQPLFDTCVARGEDTLVLAGLLAQGIQPRFLASCGIYHCPVMPFHRYAMKHFWIGYHDRFARAQLRRLGSVLMTWPQRGQTLRAIWAQAQKRKWRRLCVGATLVCYGVEALGRWVARMSAMLAAEGPRHRH